MPSLSADNPPLSTSPSLADSTGMSNHPPTPYQQIPPSEPALSEDSECLRAGHFALGDLSSSFNPPVTQPRAADAHSPSVSYPGQKVTSSQDLPSADSLTHGRNFSGNVIPYIDGDQPLALSSGDRDTSRHAAFESRTSGEFEIIGSIRPPVVRLLNCKSPSTCVYTIQSNYL